MGRETILTIGNTEYEVLETELSIASLTFYEENPRIYSIIKEKNLNQQQIEEKLQSYDYVKQLAQSIKQSGLIDPIIVRESDLAVLEGNSRLAAFRLLAKRGQAHRFTKIPSKLIKGSISNQDVDILLGQYHIVGRKDWDPYEQAAFMYRQNERGNNLEEIASSYGLAMSDLKRYIKVYKFMLENGENNPSRWSYWEEYIKARGIQRLRKDDAYRVDLDAKAIQMVNSGDIKSAQDMRKLNDICIATESKKRKKVIDDLLDGEVNFEEAIDKISTSKDAASMFNTLEKFRTFICSADNQDELVNICNNDSEFGGKTIFELKKIFKGIESIKKELNVNW